MPILQGVNFTFNRKPTEEETPLQNPSHGESIKFIFLGPIGIFIILLFGCCCLCKLYDIFKHEVLGYRSDYEHLSGSVNGTNEAGLKKISSSIQLQASDILSRKVKFQRRNETTV